MNSNMFNNIPVNRSLMKLVGVQTATYWAQLMEVRPRVFSKKTYDDNGYFLLDRRFIENQIGLSIEEQYNCDSRLNQIKVLEFDNENRNKIRVDSEKMISYLIQEDIDQLKIVANIAELTKDTMKMNKEIAKQFTKQELEEERARKRKELELEREQAKIEKQNIIMHNMQKYAIENETNQELIEKYKNWVESVYQSKSMAFLTKAIIETFKKKLNAYTNDDNIKCALLDIAVNTGYKEFDWIRDLHERNIKKKGGVSIQEQKQAGIRNHTIDF